MLWGRFQPILLGTQCQGLGEVVKTRNRTGPLCFCLLTDFMEMLVSFSRTLDLPPFLSDLM